MLEVLLLFFTVLGLIPVLVLFVQVLAAFVKRKNGQLKSDSKVTFSIIIPAHDEEAVIDSVLVGLLSHDCHADQIFVVADNCTDNTATLARAHGVNVLEREDQTHRGKGFALDFAIQHLKAQQDSPDVVIIMDADCYLETGSLNNLASVCSLSDRPVQSLYLMKNATKAIGLKQKVAEFAWIVKNRVRPLGFGNLGLPCQLMGSGMAFPWEVIKRFDLANSSIVEDMKMGIDMAREGYPPKFFDGVAVYSYFPEATTAERSQRTRWEHGHLGMILSEGPRMLWQSLTHRDLRLFALALDMMVPPLAMLVLLLVFLLTVNSLYWLVTGNGFPLFLSLTAFLLLVVSVSLAWSGWGKKIIGFKELLSVPLYVLNKLPVYLNFIFQRQKEWIRTDRGRKKDAENDR